MVKMRRFRLLLLTIAVLVVISTFAFLFLSPHLGIFPKQTEITESQAIEIGRSMLKNKNYVPGNIMLSELKEKTPNFYWTEDTNSADQNSSLLCWVIRFEQQMLSGNYFEVWIDASTGTIVGGTQTK